MFRINWGKYFRNNVILLLAISSGYGAALNLPFWSVALIAGLAGILQELENSSWEITPDD